MGDVVIYQIFSQSTCIKPTQIDVNRGHPDRLSESKATGAYRQYDLAGMSGEAVSNLRLPIRLI